MQTRVFRLAPMISVGALALGKAALVTAAWTDPVAYVRVVASLIPRELEATLASL